MKPLTKALLALSVVLAANSAKAADSAWNVDADGSWVTDGNWTANAPGATSGTTNADTATFGTAITVDRVITVDANRNIFGIDFNANSFAYTLSGGNLLLSNGGFIRTSGGGTAHTDTIASAIEIQGDGGAATFTGGSSTSTRLLTISGNISGVSTGSNVTTLTLNGTSGNFNSNPPVQNVISGIISDGAGGGKVKVVMETTSSGTWILSGNNTFSGGLTINSGAARLSGTQSFTGGITLNGGSLGDNRGNLQPGSLNGNTITVNANASIGTQNTATAYTSNVTLNAGLLTLANNNGGSTWSGAFTGAGGLVIGKLGNGSNTVNLTGTSNNFTGGVDYNNNTNGTANLNVNSFADSASLGAGNIRFGVAGGSTGTHIFTLGTGAVTSLTFNNRRFEITGNSTSNSQISNNSSQVFTINTDLLATYTSNPRVLKFGGTGSGQSTFNGAIGNSSAANGVTQNSATITSGTNTAVLRSVEGIQVGATITGSANIPGGTTITAIDYVTKTVTLSANVTANVNANTNLTIDGVINSISVTKTDSGAWRLGGVNTYTGNTFVDNGTLTLLDNAQLRFNVTDDGVNNFVYGDATNATFNIDGDFMFDLSLASTLLGDSWNIVDVATLNETFGGTFQAVSLNNGLFSESSGVWTIAENGVGYEFSELTGVLTVVAIPEPSSLALLGLGACGLLLRRRRA